MPHKLSLPKRALGQTGIEISPLGLGTVKFGRNEGVKYPQGFEIPDEAFLAEILAQAKAAGMNLLDTAPSYGASEERLGRLLAGQRADWVIAGKAGEEFEDGRSRYIFSADHFKMSLERSLSRLKTDYLDILLIHSDGNDMEILNDDELIRTMHDFKDQGLVRAIGASTKTVYGGIRTLELMDVVMASYNPAYTDELPVLEKAAEMNKGVLIKKGFASGHFSTESGDNPVDKSVDIIFDAPGVTSLIIGTINPAHLNENVSAVLKKLAESF